MQTNPNTRAGAPGIREKLDDARRQVRAATRGVQVAEGRTLDFEAAEDILRMLHAADADLTELRGCCWECGDAIQPDNSCTCHPAKGAGR